mmetsp:Transcript_42501/g.91733  ORF Transcript_42501/g.91733 Transcript_42501/m.91733 type:complete len:116 (-) Transcript_42501:14-361(-)
MQSVFGAVDSWLDRLSGGVIRRAGPEEVECMKCRALGTLVFAGAGTHSCMEAIRAKARSGNRYFFLAVAGGFFFAATWRAITPTVPHGHHHIHDITGAAGSPSDPQPVQPQSSAA